MENRRPGRRSCKETGSGWKIGGLQGVVAKKLDLDGEIGGPEGVIAEKLGLDGK